MARIMVVDDSSIMRRSMTAILQRGGHTVVMEAENGTKACAAYSDVRPDLITMDLAMPDMDGQEAIRRIMAIDPAARIVVISGLCDKDRIVEAIQGGACHLIMKPITDDKVLRVISMVLSMELSPQRRLELLSSMENRGVAELGTARAEDKPAYSLQDQKGKYIKIEIGPAFSAADADNLLIDVEEHLFGGQNRYLLDFGELDFLEHQAFNRLNQVVARIVSERGQVRALSSSANFVRFAQHHDKAVSSGLASVIRHMPVL